MLTMTTRRRRRSCCSLLVASCLCLAGLMEAVSAVEGGFIGGSSSSPSRMRSATTQCHKVRRRLRRLLLFQSTLDDDNDGNDHSSSGGFWDREVKDGKNRMTITGRRGRRELFASLFYAGGLLGATTTAAALSIDPSLALDQEGDDDKELTVSARIMEKNSRFLSEESIQAVAEKESEPLTTTTASTSGVSVAKDSSVVSSDASFDWTASPLTLSLLAGLSTCLGAAVVFCAQGSNDAGDDDDDSSSITSNNNKGISNQKKKKKRKSPLTDAHMAFSLSLAGSVMVTVSVVSILPESFQDESHVLGFRFLSFGSMLFFQRCFSFLVGCALYALLSKCAFPEPDVILGLDDEHHDNDERDTSHVMQTNDASSFSSHNDDDTALLLMPLHRNDSSTSLQSADSRSRRATSNNSSSATVATATSSRPPKGSKTNSQHQPYLRNNTRSLLSSSMDEGDDSSLPQQPIEEDEEARGGVLNKKSNKMLLDARLSTWTRLSRYSSGADLQTEDAKRAWRVAMLLFVSLAVHNFPEGLCVAVSSMHSQRLGVTTTIAIALHNIPEGIAVAVPCLAARPESPWLAFGLASLSGLAEPLGAFVAITFLQGSNSEAAIVSMNDILAFVAGIMIMVAVSELFPEACRHSKESRLPFVLGSLLGAAVMVGTEMILA